MTSDGHRRFASVEPVLRSPGICPRPGLRRLSAGHPPLLRIGFQPFSRSRVVEPSAEELERRQAWFEWYVEQQASNSVRSAEGETGPFRCPCCKCRTLDARGDFDVCPVCFWEDDGQGDHDANMVRGGPNGSLSLAQAQANFRRFGACEERFIDKVRPPRVEELPEQGRAEPNGGGESPKTP